MAYMNDAGNIVFNDPNDMYPSSEVTLDNLVFKTPITFTIIYRGEDTYVWIYPPGLPQVRLATEGGDASLTFANDSVDGGSFFIGDLGEGIIEVRITYPEEDADCEVSYDMEAIVPIAVSSELSHTGEERIHMAPAIELPPPPTPPEHKMSVELVHMYPAWGA